MIVYYVLETPPTPHLDEVFEAVVSRRLLCIEKGSKMNILHQINNTNQVDQTGGLGGGREREREREREEMTNSMQLRGNNLADTNVQYSILIRLT